MKTLKDKKVSNYNFKTEKHTHYYKENDVKKKLEEFHNAYWKESRTMDKGKKHITCDELDYLMHKYFGNLVEIETFQNLEN